MGTGPGVVNTVYFLAFPILNIPEPSLATIAFKRPIFHVCRRKLWCTSLC